jgi:hypothetical protein
MIYWFPVFKQSVNILRLRCKVTSCVLKRLLTLENVSHAVLISDRTFVSYDCQESFQKLSKILCVRNDKWQHEYMASKEDFQAISVITALLT